MAIAAADPSPAAVITCARGFTAFPAAHTPGTLVAPAGSVRDPAGGRERTAEGGEQRVVRHEPRTDEDGVAFHHGSGRHGDSAEPVVLDDESDDRLVPDGDAPGGQLLALRCRQGAGVAEEDQVRRPLTDQQRMGDRLGRRSENGQPLSRTS